MVNRGSVRRVDLNKMPFENSSTSARCTSVKHQRKGGGRKMGKKITWHGLVGIRVFPLSIEFFFFLREEKKKRFFTGIQRLCVKIWHRLMVYVVYNYGLRQ